MPKPCPEGLGRMRPGAVALCACRLQYGTGQLALQKTHGQDRDHHLCQRQLVIVSKGTRKQYEKQVALSSKMLTIWRELRKEDWRREEQTPAPPPRRVVLACSRTHALRVEEVASLGFKLGEVPLSLSLHCIPLTLSILQPPPFFKWFWSMK